MPRPNDPPFRPCLIRVVLKEHLPPVDVLAASAGEIAVFINPNFVYPRDKHWIYLLCIYLNGGRYKPEQYGGMITRGMFTVIEYL